MYSQTHYFRALVCGPTAAYPEYEIGGFENWRDIMGEFIAVAGKSVDCVSVHYYDTFVGGEGISDSCVFLYHVELLCSRLWRVCNINKNWK